MVFDLLRKHKTSQEDEQEQRRVATLLDAALAQRSKLHIRFDQEASAITGISGLLLAMKDGSLLMELSGVRSLPDRFVGQVMHCFFRVVEKADRNREYFYTFSTTILRIRQSSLGIRVVVAVPHRVECSQRRKSLRMQPDLLKFSQLAFWKYAASDGFDITKPTLPYEQFKKTRCRIDNLSAGGLRLTIRGCLLREQDLSLQKGDRFIMLLSFAEKLPRQRDTCWLVAKINNVRLDPVSGDTTFGIEFIANGTRQECGKIVWEKVAENVIDDLAQRIYAWHLALYREKGLG